MLKGVLFMGTPMDKFKELVRETAEMSGRTEYEILTINFKHLQEFKGLKLNAEKAKAARKIGFYIPDRLGELFGGGGELSDKGMKALRTSSERHRYFPKGRHSKVLRDKLDESGKKVQEYTTKNATGEALEQLKKVDVFLVKCKHLGLSLPAE
jgi:hypothetical protein